MNRKDWLQVITLIPIVWIIDRITKTYALNNFSALEFFGPLGLVLHRNPGAILGTFSELPPILRIVSLSTGGAFLVFTYASIQYLLPRKSMMLRCGMSILLGGILGNVSDRILWGSVVDWILFGNYQWATPAFNFADAIQWVGYFMIVGALIKEGNQLWPNENERKKIWINPLFQWKYCFVLVSVGLGFAIISGVFSFTYLKVTIDDIVIGSPSYIEEKFLYPFLITYLSICLGFVIMLFLIGRILSHRTVGPVYAFEKFLTDLMDGNDRLLKLRKGDEFLHLEDLAIRIREKFVEHKLIESKESPVTITDAEENGTISFILPFGDQSPLKGDMENLESDNSDSTLKSNKSLP